MSDLDVEIADCIATVTINRPVQRNSMTLAMWRDMARQFQRLSADGDVRCIILTGAGQDFSTGADISEFGEVRADADQAAAYEIAVDACSDAIQAARQPTIAALHGYCLGGGCHMAMACDFRVADATATVGIPAARLSIVYGVRSTQRLLAIVGLPAAKRILFSAERFDSEEGLRIGFVDRVGQSAVDAARAFATVMAQNAPLSIAGAKAILTGLAMGPGALDLGEAERIIAAAADSSDYGEGRAAFAAKRPPQFKGC
jgi:enoyl-CoA hydratase/carnithine racemase